MKIEINVTLKEHSTYSEISTDKVVYNIAQSELNSNSPFDLTKKTLTINFTIPRPALPTVIELHRITAFTCPTKFSIPNEQLVEYLQALVPVYIKG